MKLIPLVFEAPITATDFGSNTDFKFFMVLLLLVGTLI